MINTYLTISGDELIPSSLNDGPFFHLWDNEKQSYVKTKFSPLIDCTKAEAGLKIADKLLKAISGPTMDHEAIRSAKEEFAKLIQ